MVRKARLLACVAGLAALAAGCAPATRSAALQGQPVIDGTFSVSLTGDPGGLDPYQAATFAPAFTLAFA
jgi:ABC-type transport system substrate-binding protein